MERKLELRTVPVDNIDVDGFVAERRSFELAQGKKLYILAFKGGRLDEVTMAHIKEHLHANIPADMIDAAKILTLGIHDDDATFEVYEVD